MFREHQFVVWGTQCQCGSECSILQNQHHPWIETEFAVKTACSACGSEVNIDQKTAAAYYDRKIHAYYNGLTGTVLDFGCGGGFLSRHLIKRNGIERVIGLDVEDCSDELTDLAGNNRFTFLTYGGSGLKSLFGEWEIDFLVSRDVFMFVGDTDLYFDDVSGIVKRGVRQMGWYMKDNDRMKNRLEPEQIAAEYEKRGWKVKLELLDWYKCGYFISADRSE